MCVVISGHKLARQLGTGRQECNPHLLQHIVIESLAGYSSLAWDLCYLSVCIMSVHDLLAFRVSLEKLDAILIGLPLYVTWPFPLQLPNIFLILYIMCFDYYVSMKNFFVSNLTIK